MTHIWLRAETRDNEKRCALTPSGAAMLLAEGFDISIEASTSRVFSVVEYQNAGCRIVEAGSWPQAPQQAVILGLKELPESDQPLTHRHVMFGHAFKGQLAGQKLLDRFDRGGGVLLDLEYLTNDRGRRLAAFGFWAGYAGAAVTLLAYAAQANGELCPSVDVFLDKDTLRSEVQNALSSLGKKQINALVIGAFGRVGSGVLELCGGCNVICTSWDTQNTRAGGPFKEVLEHDLFLNCVLASDDTPVFMPRCAVNEPRCLRVIGDISCDPDSTYNPVPLYSCATSWGAPVLRVCDDPVLDVMAIDNLPSLLPYESSLDFAEQLLPLLKGLDAQTDPVWCRAKDIFHHHVHLSKGSAT